MTRYKVTIELESGLVSFDLFDLLESRVMDVCQVNRIDLYEIGADE